MPLLISWPAAEIIYFPKIMLKGITLGLVSFIIFLFLNIIILHNFNIKRRFYTILRIFLAVLLFYVLFFFFIPLVLTKALQQHAVLLIYLAFLNGAFLHFFFYYFYLHFIQIIDRSPSTRILIEIETSFEKKLSLEQLKERYSIDKKVSCELQDMVILGSLKKEGNYFMNTAKGRFHCNVFKSLREYLRLEKN